MFAYVCVYVCVSLLIFVCISWLGMSAPNLPIMHVLYIPSPVKDTVVVNDRWGGTLCAHGDSFTCADKYHPGKLLFISKIPTLTHTYCFHSHFHGRYTSAAQVGECHDCWHSHVGLSSQLQPLSLHLHRGSCLAAGLHSEVYTYIEQDVWGMAPYQWWWWRHHWTNESVI